MDFDNIRQTIRKEDLAKLKVLEILEKLGFEISDDSFIYDCWGNYIEEINNDKMYELQVSDILDIIKDFHK